MATDRSADFAELIAQVVQKIKKQLQGDPYRADGPQTLRTWQ
jgi:hypothetical protein